MTKEEWISCIKRAVPHYGANPMPLGVGCLIKFGYESLVPPEAMAGYEKTPEATKPYIATPVQYKDIQEVILKVSPQVEKPAEQPADSLL